MRGLTSCAGLVPFGVFVEESGVSRALRQFDASKTGPGVVYPMHAQLRLLIDANVAGEMRVFGLESLAADPLFVHLAGGYVPSIDTLYDDLARLSSVDIAFLEHLMAEQSLDVLRVQRPDIIHIDIDTTVEPLFGAQEGALAGPNPRYHGRPSYHPILAYCPEVRGVVGALLRPGDCGFGESDVGIIRQWIRRVREAVGDRCAIYVRIDAAGDCAAILDGIAQEGAFFVVKAKLTRDLVVATASHQRWTTVESDSDGVATLQTAQLKFQRQSWTELGLHASVVAVRSRDRFSGKQLALWRDEDLTVQCFITNDTNTAPDVTGSRYDGRAGIEPEIADLKGGWGIGKVPTKKFNANHALFLVKLLAFNLLRRFAAKASAVCSEWRTAWTRRLLICRPGKLARSGRRWTLHAHVPGGPGS